MQGMLKDLVFAYREAFRFAAALPVIFAIPVAAEFTQHVVEVQIGMFDSMAAAEAAASDPGRALFGAVKLLCLAMLLFWATRFFGCAGDVRAAARVDRGPAMQFTLALLVQALVLGAAGVGQVLLGDIGLDRRSYLLATVAVLTVQMVVATLLTAWLAAAALGDSRITVRESIRLVRPRLWYSLTYLSLVALPVMALHSALNIVAIGRSAPVMWTLLALDSVTVAYLAAVLAAANFAVARRAAERGGLTLGLRPTRTAPAH
jgi:hypothetical protein